MIDDVLAQGRRVAEVIVVDQSDEADAEALAAEVSDPRVTILRAKAIGLPRARNLALQHCSVDKVVFFDDDVRLLPGCLDAHALALDGPNVGAVAGRIVERTAPNNSRRPANRITATGRVRTNLAGFEAMPMGAVKGANMGFRRTILMDAGGFDPRYGGSALLEDADASAKVRRAGYRVVFEPAAEVIHWSAPSGGVRQADPKATERWRFHNTGLYVRAHRPKVAFGPVVATFASIAVKRGLQWRDPAAPAELMQALFRGYARGGRP